MQYLWDVKTCDESIAEQLEHDHRLHPIIAKILANRHERIRDYNEFLNPDIDLLYDPFLLHDCHKAVELIKNGIAESKKFCIYGDYDVDGVTSTVVMISVLRQLGARASWYIPNRLDEGYGLTSESIEFLASEDVDVLITVDCGISDIAAVQSAVERGITVIITDHHIPHNELPAAHAIVNPKMGDYPFKELAGVGVAYKLATALLGEQPKDLLDLVAVGTVADVVPLLSENRAIVKYGLSHIRNTALAYLVTQVNNNKPLTPDDVGFKIAPRINAVGRLGHANDAVRMLFEKDTVLIAEWARTLEQLNSQRRAIEEEIYKEACERIRTLEQSETYVLVLEGEHWHSGVIGIVASRIAEHYNRPVLLMNSAEDFARGSGRSISSIHLYDMVKSHEALFERVGGHKHAVGFTLKKENIAQLRTKLNEYFHTQYAMKDILPVLHADVEAEMGDLDKHYFSDLQKLAPFGYMNPKPVLLIHEALAPNGFSIAAEKHLRGSVTNGNVTLSCIGFDMAHHILKLSKHVDIAGAVEISTFDGLPQIKIRDIRNHIRNLAGIERESLERVYRIIKSTSPISRNELTYKVYEKSRNDLVFLDWILLIFEELEFIHAIGDMIAINVDAATGEKKDDALSASSAYQYVVNHRFR